MAPLSCTASICCPEKKDDEDFPHPRTWEQAVHGPETVEAHIGQLLNLSLLTVLKFLFLTYATALFSRVNRPVTVGGGGRVPC